MVVTSARDEARDTRRERTRRAGERRDRGRRQPARRNIVSRHPVTSILVIALVAGIVAAAWFTPVLSVRTIEVDGLVVVPEEQVLGSLDIADGTRLLQLDTSAAAARVAAIPRVAQVRVQRMYPSTVRVTVTERVAAVFVDTPDGPHLIDASGVDFAAEVPPPGIPRLVTPAPGPADPPTEAALDVVAALPESLRVQVRDVAATSISDITLTLFDERQIVWGTSAESDRKAAVVTPLLTQPGRVYIVSSPGLVSIK